jgi:pyridinium-3,5-bisthiocarboxylic acid mononucleotide nickel chelatase
VIGWLDCAAGAAGDMLLGALVDAGVPVAVLQSAVDALGTEPVTLTASPVLRQGIGATKVDVHAPPSDTSRTWRDIRALLGSAPLADPVRTLALDAFARLARAEGRVHRIDPEEVHFHEVGALDAIADVVGTAAGLHALGLTSLVCSPVTVGSGRTRGAHGPIPVPAPAVLEILREAAAPIAPGPAPYEMCTPTGAALLAAAATFGPLPPMRLATVGAGAGSRDLVEVPNILRLLTGAPTGAAPGAVLLETNVDDLDPRLWPDVLDTLLAAGASDAWLSPILMKKGRPAHTLHVLCTTAALPAVRTEVFRRTSTIGVRELAVGKTALDREYGSVSVAGQPVAVKVARLDGTVVNVSVEFEDVRRAAQALALPVKEVLRAATAAAHGSYG